MFSNINCPIRTLRLKWGGGGVEENKMMMMKKKKKETLNVSHFHGRLLLFHGKKQASNWKIFNCADLTGTEML